MKIAYILFDKMTTLDFIGFHEAVSWLGILNVIEGVSWDLCANKETITDDRGMTVMMNRVNPDLSGYDMIFIPGGMPTRELRHDPAFVTWIRSARDVRYKVSVCTGALLLGAAGFLDGKRATTNPSACELLAPYCAEVVQARAVRDGDTFTGGGVSASIDLGLYLIESLTNEETARTIQRKLDYPYYRPGKLSDVYPPDDDD